MPSFSPQNIQRAYSGMAQYATQTHRDAVVAAHPFMMLIGPYQLAYMKVRMLNPDMSHADAAIRAWDDGLAFSTKVLALAAPGAAQNPDEFIATEVTPLVDLIKRIGPAEFLARWAKAYGGPVGVETWPAGLEAMSRLPQAAMDDANRAGQQFVQGQAEAIQNALPGFK